MKIYFETNQGTEYDIEVDGINSLQQIKEEIQTHHGIPVSKQTLSFNGQIIASDADLLAAEIEDGTIILLHISDNQEDAPALMPPPPPPPPEDMIIALKMPPPPPPPPPEDMTIALKMPPPYNTVIEKVVATDTAKKLIRRVEDVLEGTSEEHLEISLKDKYGRELPENMTLLQCELLPHAEVTVDLMGSYGDSSSASPSASASGSSEQAEQPWPTDMEEDPEPEPEPEAPPPQPAESEGSSSTVPGNRISVVLVYRERRTTLEVWADQEVRHLRRRLQRVDLPEYFFIHNQAVLDENLSFSAQNILDGSVIEVLPGRVS